MATEALAGVAALEPAAVAGMATAAAAGRTIGLDGDRADETCSHLDLDASREQTLLERNSKRPDPAHLATGQERQPTYPEE
jgi:hypothetical protein